MAYKVGFLMQYRGCGVVDIGIKKSNARNYTGLITGLAGGYHQVNLCFGLWHIGQVAGHKACYGMSGLLYYVTRGLRIFDNW